MSKATEHVRVVATDLLNRLWRQRREVWDPTPRSVDDIFPLDVRAIAEKGLGVRFEEPEEIPPGEPVPRASVPVQTAGFVDRRENRIVIAQRFPSDWRRFTARMKSDSGKYEWPATRGQRADSAALRGPSPHQRGFGIR